MPPSKQDELEGMPPREMTRKVKFHGASTEAEREFAPREHVRFEIHGYVKVQATEYLVDEDTPEQEVTVIQVTSIKELG